MIKKATLYCILLVSIFGFSQEIKSYTWDENPVFETIPEEYKNQPAVVLLDKRWVHTRVGNYAFASFTMNHFAIKINKAEEINKYNKVKAEDNGYIRDVRDFHARIIKPNGQINVLPQNKIIETETDKVKSIVFEGVQAGDILEYYFIIKENPTASGLEVFQKDIPVLDMAFIFSGSGVNFNVYPSGDFNCTVSQVKSKHIWTAKNLAPHKEESGAANVRNLAKIVYLISTSGLPDTYIWKTFFSTYYRKPTFSYFKKNQAREFIENLKGDGLDTDQKLLKIDEYIKENFDFVMRGETAKKVKDLNDGKLKLLESDVFQLYGFTLKELKIPYQIVVGMSRFIGTVDNEKYVSPYSHDFMYYIPETKKFLSPSEKYLPYGYPAYELQGTKGVSYNPKKNEVNTTFVFPVAPANFTVIETKSVVNFSDDFSTATIDKTISSVGYDGLLSRNRMRYLKENKEEKDILDYVNKKSFGGEFDSKTLSYELGNQTFKSSEANMPFILKIKAEAKEALTETAGNLVLINLGKLIGNQGNLYQETGRKWDVDLNYAKKFVHTIIFNIPTGYKVESFKDLLINKKMVGDESKNCSFISTVKAEGSQLIVTVFENYNTINYPVAVYPEYRKVINASSDFTKATVVLKPKK